MAAGGPSPAAQHSSPPCKLFVLFVRLCGLDKISCSCDLSNKRTGKCERHPFSLKRCSKARQLRLKGMR